jgi:hypothetical protein
MSLDPASTVGEDSSPFDDFRRLGAEAFAFGFPFLTMAATMRHATNVSVPDGERAPINQFAHLHRFPDPDFKAIVGTNAHTLYSLAWLDLRAEPMILELPDTGGRSYLMPLIDSWSDVFVCLGPRTVGTSGGMYAIVGPGWHGEPLEGVQRIDAPTNVVWVIGHTHATGSDDLVVGLSIQKGLKLTPLSALGRAYEPATRSVDPRLEIEACPQTRLMKMGAEDFFSALAAEMAVNPPASGDRRILDRLTALGVRPGEAFEWRSLSEETREALEAGIADGREAISRPPPPRLENGWQSLREGRTHGADYLHRAQIANVALGIANPEDAVFPLAATDHTGKRLNGECRYRLRFEPGGHPPVSALWSLALYDMDQVFVPNPIDRYALGDRDDLELGPDGSLEIAIQHDRPDGSESNWLPAPAQDDFNLMLHMYWPSQQVLDGSWTIPPVQRVG